MTARSIGRRIHVIGNSCSGKSTLGARLARALGIPFVDLDALNFLPDWVGLNETDPAEFGRRIREATKGDEWVVAGSYSAYSRRIFWDRLDTVVWLDLPRWVLIRFGYTFEELRGVLAPMANERAAVGEQPGTVLAAIDGVEGAGFARLVDPHPARTQATGDDRCTGRTQVAAHSVCPTRVGPACRRIRR